MLKKETKKNNVSAKLHDSSITFEIKHARKCMQIALNALVEFNYFTICIKFPSWVSASSDNEYGEF